MNRFYEEVKHVATGDILKTMKKGGRGCLSTVVSMCSAIGTKADPLPARLQRCT